MRIRSCFLLALSFGWTHSLSADVLYSVTDLGNLGGCCSTARAINENGQVTGSSPTASSGGYEHAFLYSSDRLTDLGLLRGVPTVAWSEGYAINDAGQVTGSSGRASGYPLPFYADPFLYSNGQLLDLRPGSVQSGGTGINNAGQVTGSYSTTAFPSGPFRGFLYSNGGLTELGTLGGDSTEPKAINDAGQITGSSVTSSGAMHTFLYSNGQMIDLGIAGKGSAINNAGQITGDYTASSGAIHAFLYSDGQTIDLGTLGGTSSLGEGINKSGQVTGRYSTCGNGCRDRAFIYTNGQLLDLNDLIDPALGITLNDAPGINDKGQIVANGYDDANTHSGAYLLTPVSLVPEPSTTSLLGIALFALGIWGRMRIRSILR